MSYILRFIRCGFKGDWLTECIQWNVTWRWFVSLPIVFPLSFNKRCVWRTLLIYTNVKTTCWKWRRFYWIRTDIDIFINVHILIYTALQWPSYFRWSKYKYFIRNLGFVISSQSRAIWVHFEELTSLFANCVTFVGYWFLHITYCTRLRKFLKINPWFQL